MTAGGGMHNGLNGTNAGKKTATQNTSYNKYNSPKKTEKQAVANNASVPNNGSINGLGIGSHNYFGGQNNNIN